MTKQTINVGTAPGNQGDGDSLRDAFVKTQSNFNELYYTYPVTDTSLDHDNPAIEGTIAKALADAAAAGGGTVQLGPGSFTCPTSTLIVGDNVRLKGAGRRASVINVTSAQLGIHMAGVASSVEALHLKMPNGALSDGLLINRGEQHARDLYFSGGGTLSWAINLDAVNIAYLSNIRMGGSGNELFGNGIVIQNTGPHTFNFGDSKLSKIDITLANHGTKGIMIKGPDLVNVRINNILLSQVEVIGTGVSNGCIGIHLHNASRIVFTSVDLEQLDTGIIEEGIVGNCRNNVYIAVFAIGVREGYTNSGDVFNRLFMGCQNILPDSTSNGDVIVPHAIWLNEGSTRLWEQLGNLQIDDGDDNNGVQISVNNNTPRIQPSSNDSNAQITLGRPGTRGVECEPGIILPLQTTPITNAKDGTLAQFTNDIVGTSQGLYQLRQGVWDFIG
ncbi:MAG: hypothetical protein QM504_02410 [Pseudomonadota bacterium]